MKYIIKSINKEDSMYEFHIDCLVDLLLESWENSFCDILPKNEINKFKDYKKLKYILEKNISYVQYVKHLILFYGNKPLGLIFFKLDNLNKMCEIISFHIDYKFKNKGIGTLLFNEMEKVLKINNIKLLKVWVLENNNLAINFYKKQGLKLDTNNNKRLYIENIFEVKYLKKY